MPHDAPHTAADGLTPLMRAAGLGRRQAVAELLAAGADVLAIEPRMGATALHKAAQAGDPAVASLLLEHGAFIDQQTPAIGHTALMDAVLHKHAALVALLLARGARIATVNHNGETALALARRDGLDAIAGLIEERERADAARVAASTLAAAARAGHLTEVERLLAAGADANQRTPVMGNADDDYTPLGLAAREGHVPVVHALLAAGADPGQRNGPMKATARHEAAYAGQARALRALPGAPALDLDAQGDYNGMSALHDAVWHGHLEAVRALLDAGARPDLRAHNGLTPCELALHYGYREIAGLLGAAERRATDPTRS